MKEGRVGLTGGIASGKSAVAELLRELGAVVIDSDVLARQAVRPGSEGLARVVDEFGAAVVTSDGGLDRAALGAIVFAEPHRRRRLEEIIHPRVRMRAAELRQQAAAGSVVVEMIPLLVETGQQGDFANLVVVDLPLRLQLERLMARDGSDAAAATRRIEAQAPRGRRLSVADIVVSNAGSPADLRLQVGDLWRRLSGQQ